MSTRGKIRGRSGSEEDMAGERASCCLPRKQRSDVINQRALEIGDQWRWVLLDLWGGCIWIEVFIEGHRELA
jgi:hypothetical protein